LILDLLNLKVGLCCIDLKYIYRGFRKCPWSKATLKRGSTIKRNVFEIHCFRKL